MVTASFTSPLSYYTVSTYFGDDALLLQPEEHSAQVYTNPADAVFDPARFPYFADIPAAGTTPDLFMQVDATQMGVTTLLDTTGFIPEPVVSHVADAVSEPIASHGTVAGSPLSDTFVFAHGANVITDFAADGQDHDTLNLSTIGLGSYAELQNIATQGDDILLNFGHSDLLTLENVELQQLHRHDFIL